MGEPVIDCHHHFQRRARYAAAFPPAAGDQLDRDFTEDDLRPLLAECGIDKTVLVQLVSEICETEDCLDVQARVDYVAGVVGWIPLADPAECERALARLAMRPGKLVGIRHLIAYEPDPQWLLQPGVLESLRIVARSGLVFEGIPVNEAQFESLLAMARHIPDLKVILNHMGNPPVPEKGWEPWATQIARAAELPNLSVKFSAGLALVVRWKWSTEQLHRYAGHVIDVFGPDRMMAGSNWPVILLGARFAEAWHGLETLIAGLSEAERGAILGGTAQRIFSV